MSEMIERVARAMWAHEWGEHAEQQPFEASCREYWLDAARIAISAIRSPTEAMVAVGCEELPWGDEHGSVVSELDAQWRREALMPIWDGMLNEALK